MAHSPQHIQEEQLTEAFDPQTQEQTTAIATAASLVPDAPITSTDLEPTTTLPFAEPQPTATFPVADLDTEVPDLQLTGQEQEVQGFTEQIQALNERLIGQATFRAEREEAAGIPALQATQTDLSARLKAIQAEAKAIPLQLQIEAKGRGITVGGLRPLETARLRTNAIQALGISSLLEASRGNLTTALDLVDRMVAAKFDTIKEEIAVKRANLDLIIQSPEFSLAERNRARRQDAIQAEREREIEADIRNDRAIGIVAVEAASRGADSLTLQRIQNATSEVEATRIMVEAGFGVPEEVVTPTITPPDKPLSINQIEQFRRSFGWTPPLGFTQNQLIQYMNDNPNATPEELEAGARQIISGEEEVETITETVESVTTFIKDSLSTKELKTLADKAGISSAFKFKSVDIKNYLKSIEGKIQEAIDSGFSKEEILEFLET